MGQKIFMIVISIVLFYCVLGISTCGAGVTGRGVITGKNVNLRIQPNLSATKITVLKLGSEVTILDQTNAWFKVRLRTGREGWVFGQYLAKSRSLENSRGNYLQIFELASFAKHFLGFKYVYGGFTPEGFDCSGFAMYIYKQFGYNLPHNAAAQMQIGSAVEKNELLPGDLVFFKTTGAGRVSHVGIYLGGGQFIHASSKARGIKVSILDTDYYKARYSGARRIFVNQNSLAQSDGAA